MTKPTIPASDEAWDDETLGADADSMKAVDEETEAALDAAVGTQLVSIRMQKSMIDAFKAIAATNKNIGYQTLMRQILQRFSDSEKKKILRDYAADVIKAREMERKAKNATNPDNPPMPQKKVA